MKSDSADLSGVHAALCTGGKLRMRSFGMGTDGETEVQGLHCVAHPAEPGKHTFLFVNALTGATDHWEGIIAPALRAEGHGTVSYNFRGQAKTTYGTEDALDEAQIVSDLQTIAGAKAPDAPILVGLSIGGLFAARAILKGTSACGLVLLNTLREPGLTLDWTNEAVFRAARLGGSQLVMDMFLPMLLGPEKLKDMRAACLGAGPYEPLAEESGIYKLMERSRDADWDVPYEALTLPVLVVTGGRDRVFLDRAAVDRIKTRLPDVRETVLPEAGHLLPVEAPDEIAEALKAFAKQVSAA